MSSTSVSVSNDVFARTTFFLSSIHVRSRAWAATTFAIVICKLYSFVSIAITSGITGCNRVCGRVFVVWYTGAYGNQSSLSSSAAAKGSAEIVGISLSRGVDSLESVRSLDNALEERRCEPGRRPHRPQTWRGAVASAVNYRTRRTG